METARTASTTAPPVGARRARTTPATASARKFIGQMTPKTTSGGCQGGLRSEAYQPGSLLTHICDSTA